MIENIIANAVFYNKNGEKTTGFLTDKNRFVNLEEVRDLSIARYFNIPIIYKKSSQ